MLASAAVPEVLAVLDEVAKLAVPEVLAVPAELAVLAKDAVPAVEAVLTIAQVRFPLGPIAFAHTPAPHAVGVTVNAVVALAVPANDAVLANAAVLAKLAVPANAAVPA